MERRPHVAHRSRYWRALDFFRCKPFTEMRAPVEKLAKTVSQVSTRFFPTKKKLAAIPHEKAVVDWLQLAAPQAKLKDIRAKLARCAQIKSPGEIAFLKKAIDLPSTRISPP